MKCPNCGADMTEGSLYCEHCGEDIHIVPDYEPELDLNMTETLHSIMKDVNSGDVQDENEKRFVDNKFEPYEDADVAKKKGRRQRIIIIAMCIGAGVLLLAGLVGGMLFYQYNSYDFQLNRAMQCLAVNQYDQAISYYSRALELNSRDMEVRFSLAEAYFLKGNKVEYEYMLREIIRDGSANDEQLERAYGKLIAIYRDRGEYDTINEILLACENEKIQTAYQNYLAKTPEFSYEEGYYTEIVPLKLTATTAGRIYYTLDGSEPDENSLEYTAPIFLDNGDHTVKAFFMNEYGVCSRCVTKEYHITITQTAAPDISVISGEYSVPMMIEVLDGEDDGEVYYTTDGTEPDRHAIPYVGPIPMPVGKSEFRFAFVRDDGSISDVAVCVYQLRLNTSFVPEDAIARVVELMISTGRIYNEQGSFSEENGGQYKYQFLYAVNIHQTGDYYVIAEIFRDEEGNMTRTGSFFAVDIYTGQISRLQIDENGNYTLVEILIDSQEG